MKQKLWISILMGLMLVGCNNNSNNNLSSSINQVLTHNITYVENDKCTITLSKTEAKIDEVVEVIVSEISEGYELHKITANEFVIDNNSFIMPNEDVVVEVFLKEKTNDNLETGDYKVKIEANEYAVIETEYSRYNEGDLVNIEYTCKGYYVLDSFYVNNEKISGTTFVMPNKDVTIKGNFKYVIEETPWQLSVVSNGVKAKTFWYFTYAETGLEIKVLVDDRLICADEFNKDFGWQDNVEIILNAKSNTKGWDVDKSHKILVSSEGKNRIQKANTTSSWGAALNYESSKFNVSSSLKSLENKDGYNGYEVNMFVSYEILGLTSTTALNNISACLAMRNTNSFGNTTWGCYAGENGNWSDGSTHPLILENGLLQER